jgi:carboxypeptidase C (cathepsin A)
MKVSVTVAALSLICSVPGLAAADADRCARKESSARELPLPPGEATVKQVLRTGPSTLAYRAMAGSLALKDTAECRLADVAYTAYLLDAPNALQRPVTFVFNGGPGAASAYLHLGLIGPQRVEFGNPGNAPSDAPLLTTNPHSWLEFTDLVFVDPPGTGYSRIAYDDAAREVYGVEQDVAQLSRFVTSWLARAGRATSPKYLVGESYAGIRVAKMAHRLQKTEGVGVSGLILLSPVLDDIMIASADVSPLPWVTVLPSLAAANFEKQGKTLTAEMMAEVERYARGDYLRDLMLGARDAAAIERITQRVSAFTGLDADLVRKLGGRIDPFTFTREMNRAQGEFVSAYDTAVTSYDPYPFAPEKRGDDPILMGNIAPLASAMTDLTTRVIGWKIDRNYQLLNLEVKKAWDYGKGGGYPLESAGDLRRALSLDGRMRVLVAHGYTDIRTPYLASQLIIDQIPAMGDLTRLQLKVYPGGHMFYSRGGSASAFRQDVRAIFDRQLAR